MNSARPPNETERLEALRDFAILDTAAEQCFDDIAALAAQVCDVPMATITFVDKDRQWFKARIGIDASQTERDISFCTQTILSEEPLIVRDATLDARFADSPLVTQSPGVRFYAGFPLQTKEGHSLGALCAIDRKPRDLTSAQQTAMRALARQVMFLLDLRRVSTRLAASLERMRALEGLLPICAWCKRIRDEQGAWASFEMYVRVHTTAEITHGICPSCSAQVRAEIQPGLTPQPLA